MSPKWAPGTLTATAFARFLLPSSTAVHNLPTCLLWNGRYPIDLGIPGHSDHPGIHQARADPTPHPALLWTYSQGRLSAVGLSHGAAQQVPRQQLFCMIAPLVSFFNRSCGVIAVKQRCWSGSTVKLRITGCSRDTWKKIISLLSCLCWLRLPFISLSYFSP